MNKKDEIELAMQQVRREENWTWSFYGFGNFDKNNNCMQFYILIYDLVLRSKFL